MPSGNDKGADWHEREHREIGRRLGRIEWLLWGLVATVASAIGTDVAGLF